MDSKNRLQNRPFTHGQDAGSTASPQILTGNLRIDPAASAALAEAIRSAEQGLKPLSAPSPKPVEGSMALSRGAAGQRVSSRDFLAQAAVALALVGAGWLASYMGTLANQEAIRRLETETARSQEILTRLSGDLENLKGTLAAFKDVEHTASIASASDQDKLTKQVERLAVAVQEPGKKFTALEARLGQMESQIMSSLAGLAAKPAAPTVVEAAVRDEAPAAKPTRSEPVEGWVLREVYDGAALVEGRNRRLYEVAPGGVIPGLGRVEAIERRGKDWVVQTDKGIINSYR